MLFYCELGSDPVLARSLKGNSNTVIFEAPYEVMGTRPWDGVSLEFLANWGSFDSYQLPLPSLDGYRALATLGLLLALYLGYYMLFVVSKPRVVGGGTEFRNLVLTHCPSLSRPYWPTPWAFNLHMCTVFRFLMQKTPPVTYRR